ncbi:MAG: Uma2 family endonuclease [Deltaproteobacteria bacterium]|nr:Uma2 family endonuclease [Deltaproteobacteria bacterium]
MPATARQLVSYAEYLAAEELSATKHEYIDGQVVAMAGGTMAHATLVGNCYGLAFTALAGRPCRPYNESQRIRIPATDLSTYPDLSIVCGPRLPDEADRHAATNPTVLVEVLSPGTAAYDRGEKFDHYKQLPSLREYVLVESTRVHVDVYSLDERGEWVRRGYGPGSSVPLPSVGISVDLDALYEGWEPDADARLPTPPRA